MSLALFDISSGKEYVATVDRFAARVCIMPPSARYLSYFGITFDSRCYPSSHLAIEELDRSTRLFPRRHIVGIVLPEDLIVRTLKTIVMFGPYGVKILDVWLSIVKGKLVDRLRRTIEMNGSEVIMTKFEIDTGHVIYSGYGTIIEREGSVEVRAVRSLPTYSDFLRALDILMVAAQEGGQIDTARIEELRKTLENFALDYARCEEELKQCKARLTAKT